MRATVQACVVCGLWTRGLYCRSCAALDAELEGRCAIHVREAAERRMRRHAMLDWGATIGWLAALYGGVAWLVWTLVR